MNRDVCVCRVCVCPCKQFGYCDFWIQTEPRSRARGCGALRRNGFARAGGRRRRAPSVGRFCFARAKKKEKENDDDDDAVGLVLFRARKRKGNDERVNRIERTRGGWVAAAFIQ